MNFDLDVDSATDLVIKGTTGSFAVDGPNGSSVPVEYLLTYAGFNDTGMENKLLRQLTPVRELFDLKELDFDELLQRDLDDARISEELIPYLLDVQSSNLIRIFPPIVVLLLPLGKTDKKPGEYYEEVEISTVDGTPYPVEIIQSGATGSEAFKLKRPIVNERVYHFAENELSINTSKICLAIVDGQHRAMALLALQRNLERDWDYVRRMPYEHFYKHWSGETLQNFDLKKVSLPLMVCMIPEIHKGVRPEINLVNAARSIFLALNKNARAVSDSRNRLLDDNDICAEYLRTILTDIKSKTDESDRNRIQIWNIELDQTENKISIQSPVAISAVNHLYPMIEHLVFRKSEQEGVADHSPAYWLNTSLREHFRRVGAQNVLPQVALEPHVTSRRNYSLGNIDKLKKNFMRHYGDRIIRIISEVAPLHNLIGAYTDLEVELNTSQQVELLEVIYGISGMSQSMSDHIKNLKKRVADGNIMGDVNEANRAVDKMEKIITEADSKIKVARSKATEAGLGSLALNQSSEKIAELGKWNEQWTTRAWQSAVIFTFFETCEKVMGVNAPNLDLDEELSSYIGSINSFFCPQDKVGLDKLKMLYGNWRAVMNKGNLKPADWPSIRFIILEIWKPSSDLLLLSVEKSKKRARNSAFKRMYERNLRQKAIEFRKPADELDAKEKSEIFDTSFLQLSDLLKAISARKLDRDEMKKAIIEQDEIEESEIDLD